ncbi:MAG TPA: condensation domain-containing protein, partial [Pseudonocardiaceae bacterium]
MASVVMVPFHGDGAGVAELTWGQREIWAAMRTQRSRLPIGGVVPLPAGRDVDAVAAALRFTMSRHQSLRTRLRFEPDGSVRQVLSDHGEVPLHVVDVPDDSDPAAVAAELEARIRSEPFDYEHDWPVQMTVIRHRGVATHLLG